MAKEETKVEVIKHENIFEALSAFQGENPEITRSSKVSFKDKNGNTVEFMYAPLDEVLKIVRPLLAKHGLSVTFGGDKEGQLICSLYHSTYKLVQGKTSTKMLVNNGESSVSEVVTDGREESGVIRSLPIKVSRSGAMKDIGSDSTYARRYMLAEVLGVSSDEDKDADVEEKAQKNAESFAYSQVEKQLKGIKTLKEINEKLTFLEKELATAKDGKKAPSLGLKAEQYEKLIALANERAKELDVKVDTSAGEVDPSQLPDDLK